MSAYAHQMERAFSARTLSSRGGSEMESRNVVESGFYMTSFAATIFIGALVAVGVLFVTLLISLTVMLQSCQSSSKGIVEIPSLSDDYNYCKIFALHAELNSLEPDNFPSVCRTFSTQYMNEGQFKRDVTISLRMVERYFIDVTPLSDGLDVVLMDVDDILPPNPHQAHHSMHRLYHYDCGDCLEEAKHLKQTSFMRLFMKLKASKWSLILFSRKPEKQRNATIEFLTSAGYSGWSSMVMRSDGEMETDTRQFFSRQRAIIQRAGFRMAATISSQMDALTGPCLGERVFKLPNPVYYHMENAKIYLPD